MRLLLFVISTLALMPGGCESGRYTPQKEAATKPAVVYLVRHAEKQLGAAGGNLKDPPLTQAGERRAQQLANMLEHENIDYIFSTPLMRTRQTVAPLAALHGITIQGYDAGNLSEFADILRQLGGRIVVSGHSNTTPELVRLLGGEPGELINDNWEYNRIYMLVIDEDKTITLPLRYGDKPQQAE